MLVAILDSLTRGYWLRCLSGSTQNLGVLNSYFLFHPGRYWYGSGSILPLQLLITTRMSFLGVAFMSLFQLIIELRFAIFVWKLEHRLGQEPGRDANENQPAGNGCTVDDSCECFSICKPWSCLVSCHCTRICDLYLMLSPQSLIIWIVPVP